jgi:hypothetical protein
MSANPISGAESVIAWNMVGGEDRTYCRQHEWARDERTDT